MAQSAEGRRVVVIGAGVMGSAIAQVLATAGARVTCHDRSADQLRAAAERVRSGRYGWDRAVARDKLSPEDADRAAARLDFSPDLDVVGEADLVVEAVPEDLALKLEVFADLGAMTPGETILATNTSGLPVVAMAAAAGRPDRVIGWHWSSPAQVMPLAEIVRTDTTDDAVVHQIRELALACGKRPNVVVENPQAWGFVANRVLRAAIREARLIESEGLADAVEIDQIMVDAFGWPAGPLSVLEGASEGWGDGQRGSVASHLG